MTNYVDFVEHIAIYIVQKALEQLKSGNIAIIERYNVTSDGEDVRFSVQMLGRSRVYAVPIIQIVDPVVIEKKMDELCRIFEPNINSIIFNIRNKELARR